MERETSTLLDRQEVEPVIQELSEEGWLVEDWLPIGHRGMIASVEGCFKTMLKCWWSVCVAAGKPIFGKKVEQCPVLIIDEETPQPDLVKHLHRFAVGLGFKGWTDLPIEVLSQRGFRIGRKTLMDRIVLPKIRKINARFVSLDSVYKCLPEDERYENDSSVGGKLGADLDTMLREMTDGTILVNAHCRELMGELSVKNLKAYEMSDLVRGIGSIVGQACDTGYLIKKISEPPEPTRFVIVTRARRRAIPMTAHDIYVEMIEPEGYGLGGATLQQIDPVVIPPSRLAKSLFALIEDSDDGCSGATIRRESALYSSVAVLNELDELEARGAIISLGAFKWAKNPNLTEEVDEDYIANLKRL